MLHNWPPLIAALYKIFLEAEFKKPRSFDRGFLIQFGITRSQ